MGNSRLRFTSTGFPLLSNSLYRHMRKIFFFSSIMSDNEQKSLNAALSNSEVFTQKHEDNKATSVRFPTQFSHVARELR